LLLAAGNAWTQDVFASNGGDSDSASGSSTPPVYQDSFSNNCDKTNNQSLNVDGYNPAICEKLTTPTPQDCLSNPAETGYALVKQQGNACYFCEQPVPPAKYHVIVPEDLATAVYQQAKGALYCGRTAADPCYWECYGNVPPVVPTAGVTPMPPAEFGVTGQNPPTKFQLRISNTDDDPCYPAGPKNYNVCDYPNLKRPPGCNCSKTPAPQAAKAPKPQPKTTTTSQAPDEGTYLQGIVDGIGTCLQSLQANFIGLTAGAGYFAKGDFVHAAEFWGVQPGQSAVLNQLTAPFKSLYNDMTTPQVGVVSKVSDYQRGVTGGKNLCKYWLIPAAKQAIKSALNSGPQTTGGTPSKGSVPQIPSKGGTPPQLPGGNGGTPPQLPGGSGSSGSSPPQLSGGPLLPAVGSQLPAVAPNGGQVPSVGGDTGTYAPTVPPSGAPADAAAGGGDGLSPATPLWGGPLQLDLDRDPKALVGKYIKLPDGRVIQLGPDLGKGGFAVVYKYGDLAIKLSKNEGAYGYGPESLAGQNQGAERLQGTGVQIPKTYEYQPGGNGVPASFVTGDANTEFPGYKEITPQDFQALPAASQAGLLKAMTGLTNAIAGKGYVLGDPNLGNIRFRPVAGGGYQAMLLDTDMVMTIPEVQAAAAAAAEATARAIAEAAGEPVTEPWKATPAERVQGGVLTWGLELAGQPNFDLNTATAQSLTDVLNEGRADRLAGVQKNPNAQMNVGGGTAPQ
jgi:hypothetical protein